MRDRMRQMKKERGIRGIKQNNLKDVCGTDPQGKKFLLEGLALTN